MAVLSMVAEGENIQMKQEACHDVLCCLISAMKMVKMFFFMFVFSSFVISAQSLKTLFSVSLKQNQRKFWLYLTSNTFYHFGL